MEFTFLVIYITIIALLCTGVGKRNAVSVFLFLSFLAIGWLIAFRGTSTGADTANYYRMYDILAEGSISDHNIEAGFVIFVRALRLISTDPQALFITQGILVAICYIFFFRRNVENLLQSYIAVLCFLAFNLFSFHLTGVRQSFAICICVFAYEIMTMKTKKVGWQFIAFLLVVLLASSFHTSALMFLPAYFIIKLTEPITVAVSVITALLGIFATEEIMEFLFSWNERYSAYGIEQTGNGYIFFAVMTVIMGFYLIFKNGVLNNNTGIVPHARLNILHYGLWAIRLATRTIERVAFYYTPATIIVLAQTPRSFTTVKNKYIYVIILSALLIGLFLYRIGTINYSFCWEV